jgi:hypothetical protein
MSRNPVASLRNGLPKRGFSADGENRLSAVPATGNTTRCAAIIK